MNLYIQPETGLFKPAQKGLKIPGSGEDPLIIEPNIGDVIVSI
jgi:hypothetical protein